MMDQFKITFVCLLASLPAIAGLSCLECQDVFLDTDNQALRDLFAKAGLRVTPACRAPVDNKTTTLPVKQCPMPTGGLVSSCIFAIGSASASGGGESIELTYTQRGCATIPKDKKDTCEESTPPNLPAGASDAEGSICYCSTDKCNGQTRLTPTVAVFFLSLVAFCFLRQ